MSIILPTADGPSATPLVNASGRDVYTITAIAALGGLLFGFDLVIVSGAVPFFVRYFNLSDLQTGWAVGCINIGAAVGALLAGRLSDAIGRKKSLLLCALLFALTGIGMGWSGGYSAFIAFRLLAGVAVGAAALVCPMYIAEMAPSGLRGRLVTFYQLAIVTGLLLGYLTDYALLNTGENNWRWMFSSQTIPAVLFLIGLVGVPESPRWLIKRSRAPDARAVLTRVGGAAYAGHELAQISQTVAQEAREDWRQLLQSDVRRIVLIGVLVAVFSQADGQNSLFLYAPQIFQQAGFAPDSAFLQSVILGVINFIFTFVAIGTVDRIGRRKLLLYGAALLGFDALALAVSFWLGASAYWVLAFVLGFIGIFAATLGPVTWVALSELFPTRIRGSAMAVATLTLWIANFFTTASFPVLKAQVGLGGTFAVHSGICFLYYVIVKTMFPETKGKSLEQIETELTRSRVTRTGLSKRV